MLSVKAIYDGKTLQLLEPVDVKMPQEVIITFLHDVPDAGVADSFGQDIGQLIQHSASFDFLNADEEDVYTDANLKIRY